MASLLFLNVLCCSVSSVEANKILLEIIVFNALYPQKCLITCKVVKNTWLWHYSVNLLTAKNNLPEHSVTPTNIERTHDVACLLSWNSSTNMSKKMPKEYVIPSSANKTKIPFLGYLILEYFRQLIFSSKYQCNRHFTM